MRCQTGTVPGDVLELRVAWSRHLGGGPTSLAWFDRVVARHRASGRHYHDLRHVTWVIRHLDRFERAGALDDAAAVVAAGCFHDAVYDPTSHANEAASAELAQRALGELGWDDDRIERVAAMILATADHDVAGVDRDTAALLAADLAVLAAEPTRYADYVRAVRREYAHVGDDDWRRGRGDVLRRLLGRPRLYAPSLGLDEWEQRARANMAAELASLTA
jgi:predicted metal-dependent HD superfamily phosphohydrolase